LKLSELKFYGTGRRKNAIARVYLRSGTGEIVINDRELEKYFPRLTHHMAIRQPLELTNSLAKFNIYARVHGGGLSGQAGAMQLGIARALVQANTDFRPLLRQAGLLTRDPRVVERKKPGQKGARRRFQFSKR
jgi:small subunit ribosomal protein S9